MPRRARTTRPRGAAATAPPSIVDRALPAATGTIRLDPLVGHLLRAAVADGRLPLLVFPWEPRRQGWRAAQAAADAVARSARATGTELDAAYFVVPPTLDAAGRDRLPAEGAPQADQLFPLAARELGLDLARCALAGAGDALAAAASGHGVRPFSLTDR